MLCCVAFTATAGSVICVCDMSDKTDIQQNPVDKTSDDCHTDQDTSSDEPINDCCPDMGLCNGALFISHSSPKTAQIIHQVVQFPQNEQIVLNTSTPPRRPPKLIN
jgi:hypothetical protein